MATKQPKEKKKFPEAAASGRYMGPPNLKDEVFYGRAVKQSIKSTLHQIR